MKSKGQRNAPNRIPDWLCAPCAKRLGGQWPVGEKIGTHFDFCGQCDEFTDVYDKKVWYFSTEQQSDYYER